MIKHDTNLCFLYIGGESTVTWLVIEGCHVSHKFNLREIWRFNESKLRVYDSQVPKGGNYQKLGPWKDPLTDLLTKYKDEKHICTMHVLVFFPYLLFKILTIFYGQFHLH